ncbi:MAG TPA: hypothetical protein VM364_16025 [Vicinamibacterales bacterium]|nr:hypothetical protein [Vicinamibacterales bacterium]HWI20696.1 hypothetical protein [Vicinamibacterales bacterium]
MMPEPRLAYLYSSNQSRLYEQDILDVLAAPRGSVRQFRYEEGWLAPSLRDRVEDAQGTDALIHFSLQQEEKYHDAVVIPVRWARIQEAAVSGGVCTLQLRMAGWCSLKAPRVNGRIDFDSKEARDDKTRIVKSYQEWLRACNAPRPYDYWAGLGPTVSNEEGVFEQAEDGLLFRYCSQYLRATRSFTSARFYRIKTVRTFVGSSEESRELEADDDGIFGVTGGRTLIVELAHFQPVLPQSPERVRVATDGRNVLLIGKPEFEIASRYDVVSIELHVVEPSTTQAQETAVLIEPDGSMFGARIRLRLRVLRSAMRTATGVTGAALAAVLLGLPTVLPMADSLKALSIAAATVLTAMLASAGLRR